PAELLGIYALSRGEAALCSALCRGYLSYPFAGLERCFHRNRTGSTRVGVALTCGTTLDGAEMTTTFYLFPGFALFALLSSQCFPVNAQEQQGVSGIGAQKCAILTARATAGTNPNDMLAVLSWVQGFISGLNMNAENEFYYDLTSMPENEQNTQ